MFKWPTIGQCRSCDNGTIGCQHPCDTTWVREFFSLLGVHDSQIRESKEKRVRKIGSWQSFQKIPYWKPSLSNKEEKFRDGAPGGFQLFHGFSHQQLPVEITSLYDSRSSLPSRSPVHRWFGFGYKMPPTGTEGLGLVTRKAQTQLASGYILSLTFVDTICIFNLHSHSRSHSRTLNLTLDLTLSHSICFSANAFVSLRFGQLCWSYISHVVSLFRPLS